MGRYQLFDLIFSSHTSRIYVGLDKENNHDVIIKELLLPSGLAKPSREELIKQFELEAEILIKLNHPNLPEFLNYIITDKNPYLIMNNIDGESYIDFLEYTPELLEEKRVIKCALQLCNVLDYLHNFRPYPVIFKNLTPENIIVDENETITLSGFGISKIYSPLIKSFSVKKLANFHYSPPEQYSGKTDKRSDIYSFGATLYYIATKIAPVDSLDRSMQGQNLPLCSEYNKLISQKLALIIDKSMSLKKSDRYQTVSDIQIEIKEYLSKKDHFKAKSRKKSGDFSPSGGFREKRFVPSSIVSEKLKELRSPERQSSEMQPIPYLSRDTLLMNRYRVIDLVNESNLNRMYRGVDTVNKNIIAIKELLMLLYLKSGIKNGQFKSEEIKKFHDHTEMLLTLSHPNLPYFEGYFNYQDKRYLIMEYVEGETLQSVMENSRELPRLYQVMEWILQVCNVINYLHKRKPKPVIFRGLCPENIILQKNGVIKLIDFGLSKLYSNVERTLPGARIAKYNFSPPEQYSGQTDERSDIYSLGSTIYYLLSGIEPEDSVDRVISKTPLSPCREVNKHVPAKLDEIILKSTELFQEERFQTIEEVKNILEGLFPSVKKRVDGMIRSRQ